MTDEEILQAEATARAELRAAEEAATAKREAFNKAYRAAEDVRAKLRDPKKVHGGLLRSRDGHDRCAYCGSITPAEALRRMRTPGCRFSGTDKGGYKFYFDSETGDHGKFYGEHLRDLTEAELAEWNEASLRCLGVDWLYREGQEPRCYMPAVNSFGGWQTWGVIDQDGNPVFQGPTPPGAEWWANARAQRNKP